MFLREVRLLVGCLAISVAVMPAARAQWAVIDVGAIVQLVQEVQEMEQEIAVAKSQLQQAKQALQSMSGNRGMQNLLGGTNRNYLPPNWTQLSSSLQSSSNGYPGLSNDVQSTVAANAVLSPQRLAMMPLAEQQQIQADRLWVAAQQVLSRDALANTSNRFAAIQRLIDAIPTAVDQKGILDLQARISAELGMLQNEQTKLQVLSQATLAQQSAYTQQAREQVIAGHGQFAARFQPALELPRN
jgi:type IV secretion system protein VirB5